MSHRQDTSTMPQDNDPVRLADAVRLFFPYGGLTLSTLRTEARNGNLAIERIGGKDFVTKHAIDEMRKRCLVKAKAQGSISGSEKDGGKSGLSGMDKLKQAQAASSGILAKLKGSSGNTSRKNGNQKPNNVIKLKSI